MKPLPAFTAVVHLDSLQQAEEQAALAFAQGAGGVFLIDHLHSEPDRLLAAFWRVRERFPQAWLGLNFLCFADPAAAVAALPGSADALWLDSMAGFDAHQVAPHLAGRIFGAAAFKYQRTRGTPEDQARTVAVCLRAGDVVTTSGPGTGQAATVGKIQAMKYALDGRLLALASGVTPENVAVFLPYVDCFLVATGIMRPGSQHEFDPKRVKLLADVIAAGLPERSGEPHLPR